MIEDIAIDLGLMGLGEAVFLISGIYCLYRYFIFKEVETLIFGIFLLALVIFCIVYWIIKKESFFTHS